MPKKTQQEVDYRLGHPMTQCSTCQMYRKTAQSPFGSCTDVTGKITAYGVCELFSALNNPFGNYLTVHSRQALADVYHNARQGPRQ